MSSELSKFVKRRAVDNIRSGVIYAVRAENPLLFDVRMPDGKLLTLPTAENLSLAVGDPVEVALPAGDQKRAYIAGLAAVVQGGDPFNRILASGVG